MDDEAADLAAHLGIDVTDFRRRYLRKVGGRYCLIDRPNRDCIFLDGGGCTVYEARPTQCRTFPFWPENLASERTWAVVCLQCRGSGTGELYELGRMHEIRSKHEATTSGPTDGCSESHPDSDPGERHR